MPHCHTRFTVCVHNMTQVFLCMTDRLLACVQAIRFSMPLECSLRQNLKLRSLIKLILFHSFHHNGRDFNLILLDLFIALLIDRREVTDHPHALIKIKESDVLIRILCVTRFIEHVDVGLLATQLDARIEPSCEHAAATCGHERLVIRPLFAGVMRENDRDVVHLNQHVDAVHELSDVGVVILLAIEEVNDGVDHDNVGLVIGNLIAELLDVLILHQVLSQPAADDEVVVAKLDQFIATHEPLKIHFDPALQEFCDDLCLKPHDLERPVKRDAHEICAGSRSGCECSKPVRLTDLGLTEQEHPAVLKYESLPPKLFDTFIIDVCPQRITKWSETKRAFQLWLLNRIFLRLYFLEILADICLPDRRIPLVDAATQRVRVAFDMPLADRHDRLAAFNDVERWYTGLIPVLRFDQDLPHAPAFADPLAHEPCERVVARTFRLGFFSELLSDRRLMFAAVVERVNEREVFGLEAGQIIHPANIVGVLAVHAVSEAGWDHDVPTLSSDIKLVQTYAVTHGDLGIAHAIKEMSAASRCALYERCASDRTRLNPIDCLLAICIQHRKRDAGDRCPVGCWELAMPFLYLLFAGLCVLVMRPSHPWRLRPLRSKDIFCVEWMSCSKVLRDGFIGRSTWDDVHPLLPHLVKKISLLVERQIFPRLFLLEKIHSTLFILRLVSVSRADSTLIPRLRAALRMATNWCLRGSSFSSMTNESSSSSFRRSFCQRP